LAIELYRREHGKLPAELSDLVPDFLDEVPIDPFTGDPLIYRVDEDAIVIYSVGRNGVDDGGVVNKEGEPLDHVVRVLRK
ncbi:MAG: general secretion pathway protein GspG, partial [bacterium]|nr:general secretion pathway protein GspG [bacterium]